MRAAGGDRRAYQPLCNQHFPSPEPEDVIRRLLAQCPYATFYIADLDAITGNDDNTAQIHTLARSFPDLSLWLDCGIRNYADFERLRLSHDNADLIVASETMSNQQLPTTLRAKGERFILSLDFDAGGLRGDVGLLECAEDWPDTVIALSLSAVGAAAGPDFAAVAEIRKKSNATGKSRRLIAGGGVRDTHDLAQLQRAGADAVLVANALYTDTLAKLEA